MNYMVDGKLNLNGLEKDQLDALAVEFEFYSIDVPEALSNAITPPAPPVMWSNVDYAGFLNPGDTNKVLITNADTSVTYMGEDVEYGHDCSRVNGLEPCNRFSVRIDSRGERGKMEIGLYEKDMNPRIRNGAMKSYCLWLHNGSITRWIRGKERHHFTEDRDYSVLDVVDGDVITMIREGSTIIFKKNGVSLGEAFTDVPEDIVLYPFIRFRDKRLQITSMPTPNSFS